MNRNASIVALTASLFFSSLAFAQDTSAWQGYVKQLMSTGKFTQVAIVDLNGNNLATTGLALRAGEAAKLVFSFGHWDSAKGSTTALIVAGKRYLCAQAESEKLVGLLPKEGIYVFKTKTAILIGTWAEPAKPIAAMQELEKLATALKAKGL